MRSFVLLLGLACHAQVNADSFQTAQVTGVDFNTLNQLAQKWEDESKYSINFHDGMNDRQLWYAHGQVDTLDKCAKELRKVVDDAKPSKEQFVYQQAESFGHVPPRPDQLPKKPDLGPGGDLPYPNVQPVQKYPVQIPAAVCQVNTVPVAVQAPVRTGWRPFGAWRSRGLPVIRRFRGGC